MNEQFPKLKTLCTPIFLQAYLDHIDRQDHDVHMFDTTLDQAADNCSNEDFVLTLVHGAFAYFWQIYNGLAVEEEGVLQRGAQASMSRDCPALSAFAEMAFNSACPQEALFDALKFASDNIGLDMSNEVAIAEIEVELYKKAMAIVPVLSMLRQMKETR